MQRRNVAVGNYTSLITFNVSESYLPIFTIQVTVKFNETANQTATCKSFKFTQNGFNGVTKCTDFKNCNPFLIFPNITYDFGGCINNLNSNNSLTVDFVDKRDSGCPNSKLNLTIENYGKYFLLFF